MLCSRLLIVALTVAPSFAQSVPAAEVPKEAVIIERAEIPTTVNQNQEPVLWMIAPTKHHRGPLSNNPYTCPEWTLGSYYQPDCRYRTTRLDE
jgi:hypothetical protein